MDVLGGHSQYTTGTSYHTNTTYINISIMYSNLKQVPDRGPGPVSIHLSPPASTQVSMNSGVEAGGLRWMPTGLGLRSGTCFKLEYKWLRVCSCRADDDVDVDGVGVL